MVFSPLLLGAVAVVSLILETMAIIIYEKHAFHCIFIDERDEGRDTRMVMLSYALMGLGIALPMLALMLLFH